MIQIRKARPDEFEIIIHHRVEMIRSMGWTDEQIIATKEATLHFLKKPWDPNIECYFAIEEDKVIGGCAVSFGIAFPSAKNPSGKYAYLYNMYIEPEHRRKGVGTSILRHIIGICQERGIEKVTLHDTKMSKSIYEREGFVRSENYYTMFIPI